MKWGLQHVKVTLEDADSGEIVVIEQRPDGTLICKEGSVSKSAKGEEKAANERPPREHAKAAEPKPESKPKPPKEEAKAAPPRKDEAKKDGAKKPRKPRESKPKSTEKSSKKALAWKAVKDNNYDGFAAKVRVGVFKALHARNTQWALFFERKDSYPAHLGCFRKLEQAKARAQELHDAGWPEIEFGEVTRELVERACPVPGAEREEKPTMKPKSEEKAETKPEEKSKEQAAAPQAAAANGGVDAVMMRSFTQAAESLLADDEDDD